MRAPRTLCPTDWGRPVMPRHVRGSRGWLADAVIWVALVALMLLLP